MTTQNVAAVYDMVLGKKYLEKERSLTEACLSYILASLTEVVKSESFSNLDGSVAKRILIEGTLRKGRQSSLVSEHSHN